MQKQIIGFLFIALCVGSRPGAFSYRIIQQRASTDVAVAPQVRQSSLALIRDSFRIFFILLKLLIGRANLVELGTASQQFLVHLGQTFSVSNLLNFVPFFGGPLRSLVEEFSSILEHTPFIGHLLSGILVGPDEFQKPYSWDYIKKQITSLESGELSSDSGTSSQEYSNGDVEISERSRNKLIHGAVSSQERLDKGDIKPLDNNSI